MTKTALSQLQQQIEAVRREAFAEGYAVAMQRVQKFAAGFDPATGAIKIPTVPVMRAGLVRETGAERAGNGCDAHDERLPARRLQRGTNAKLIEAVLQSIAPRAARPSEIRNLLRREQGVALAFTSIRHALGQLQGRHAAEQVAQSKTWRYLSEGAAASGPGRLNSVPLPQERSGQPAARRARPRGRLRLRPRPSSLAIVERCSE